MDSFNLTESSHDHESAGHTMNAGRLASALRQGALDLLFPSKCAGCGRAGELLCRTCLGDATRLDSRVCRHCATPTGRGTLCGACAAVPPALYRLIAAFTYDGAIRRAIHSFKYQDIRALAPVLADALASDPRLGRLEADALVPVPLHERRLRERGYNQAELLARELGTRMGLPMRTDLVRRVGDGPSQLDAADRRANVERAFEAEGEARGMHLMLVDDVATTGSTLNACAHVLLKAGAGRVGAIVVAKDL